MLKLHKKGSNSQLQRQLLATISLPSARGCCAAAWWPASGSPRGSGWPVWAYRVASPDYSPLVTPPPWGRWSPGATAPQTSPHPPHHPRSLLQQTTIMFVTINILPESLKCFAAPKNVVKPVIVHILRCDVQWYKQETPQCDENQVFNDSTKYWYDRNKKWKMAVKKKWCPYFGCTGCMHEVWCQ